jgi:DNA-binding protein YbaB
MRTDLQLRLGAMLEEYRATRSRIADVEVAAAGISATVRSPDRCATVTVDGHGELRDLRIDPVVAARLDARVLSERILGATRLATAQAREHVRVMMRDALPEPLRDLVRVDGSVDLTSLLPTDLGDGTASWGYRP